MKEQFVGEGFTPEDASFSASAMAMGKPGLPQGFSWKGKSFSILEVLEEWKEAGNCRRGSGERYVRKHWFRVRTSDDLEMKFTGSALFPVAGIVDRLLDNDDF